MRSRVIVKGDEGFGYGFEWEVLVRGKGKYFGEER